MEWIKKMNRYNKINEIAADYLVERQQQLLADLNYQLIVDTELKHCIYGKVLWVESISTVRLPGKCNPYTNIDQGL